MVVQHNAKYRTITYVVLGNVYGAVSWRVTDNTSDFDRHVSTHMYLACNQLWDQQQGCSATVRRPACTSLSRNEPPHNKGSTLPFSVTNNNRHAYVKPCTHERACALTIQCSAKSKCRYRKQSGMHFKCQNSCITNNRITLQGKAGRECCGVVSRHPCDTAFDSLTNRVLKR